MAQLTEHLLQPRDVSLGLLQVVFECPLELGELAARAIFGRAFTSCFSAS